MIQFARHRRLLLSGILLMILSVVRGQSLYPVSTDEKIRHAALIVEGKVIEKKSYWNASRSMIYTTNKVEVYKVFKGTLQNTTTIDVITVGGVADGQIVVASHLLELERGDIGMFFCAETPDNMRPADAVRKAFKAYSSAQGFLKYDLVNKTAAAPFSKFENISGSLYSEIRKWTGRKATIINRTFNADEVSPIPTPSGTIISQSVQAPAISSFSPTTVFAGRVADPATNVLTITGSGFGSATGQAAVEFSNANAAPGNYHTVLYDKAEHISWTNTEIKIKVPSAAGTGNIRVRDASGAIATSSAILTVPYSILAADLGGSYGIKQLNLVNDNGSGGYTIKFSTNTANSGVNIENSPAKATFLRALNTWKEGVGVNFVDGGGTSNQAINANDNENVVVFDNGASGFTNPMDVGVLATCYSYAGACGTNPAGDQAFTSGFDIIIRNPGFSQGTTFFTYGPCPPMGKNPPEVDLETVLLHELGHALGLAHIIDPAESNGKGTNNPAKVMNFSVTTHVRRISLDQSSLTGGLYMANPRGFGYGNCIGSSPEMTTLNRISEAKDDCPVNFPTSVTPLLSTARFDLVHATSNKFTDPHFDEFTGNGDGTSITNTAFYAFRTNSAGGDVILEIKNYTTTPEDIAACVPPSPSTTPVTGIQMAIYKTNSCPVPGNYPNPILYTTFTGNGVIPTISGLDGNSTYLMVVDGVENTKAIFDIVFSGPALSPKVISLDGSLQDKGNLLSWTADISPDVSTVSLERSEDGNNFSAIANIGDQQQWGNGNYVDTRPLPGDNHYRLAVHNINGSVDYSSVTLLTRTETFFLNVFPNPLNATSGNNLTIEVLNSTPGRYGLVIYNTLGEAVLQKTITMTGRTHVETLNMHQFAKGLYHVTVYGEGKKSIKSTRLVVK